MSRSLSRIRNLVSEIEEIHRQGQQGGKSALTRTASLKPEPVAPPAPAHHTFTPPAAPVQAQTPAPQTVAAQAAPVPAPAPAPVQAAPTPTISAVPPVSSFEASAEEEDPFAELDTVVTLDDHRDTFNDDAPKEAKVYMQLSGAVALSLQIEDTGEMVELKQVGDLLEIRFTDGKAFHIPLNSVA